MDWGHLGSLELDSIERQLWGFTFTLGYSRMMMAEAGPYVMTAHDLVDDLGRAYREGRLERRMKVYLSPKVLIID